MPRQDRQFKKLLVCIVLLTILVSFSGVVAGSTSEVKEDRNYWVGQELEYIDTTNNLTNSEVELQEVENNNSVFLTELQPESSDKVRLDTSSLAPSDYQIVVVGDNQDRLVQFDVLIHTLDITAEDTNLINNVLGESETSFELSSSRADFSMNVSSDNLSAEKLKSVFGEGEVIGNNTLQLNSNLLESANFSGVSPGDYSIRFNSVDTNASSTYNLTVTQKTETANFTQDVFNTYTGDSEQVSVNLTATRTAKVILGNEKESGYRLEFEVEDADLDGEVTFNLDAYMAGQSTDVVSSQDDRVTVVEQTQLRQRLESESYMMSLQVNRTGEQRQTDLSFYNVDERSTGDATSFVLTRENTVTQYEDLISVENTSEKGLSLERSSELTETDVITNESKLVLGFETNGIFGILNQEEIKDAGQMSEGSSFSSDYGIYLDVFESEAAINEEPTQVSLSDATLHYSENDELVFLVYRVDGNTTDLEIGNEYTAQLVITEENPYQSDGSELATTNFTLEEERTEFTNVNQNGRVELEKSNESEVVVDTNLPDGTKDELIVTVPDSENPSVEEYDTTVQNGEMNVTLNTSSLDVGDNLNLELVESDINEITGVVVEPRVNEYALTVNVLDEDGLELNGSVSLLDENLSRNGSSVTFDVSNGNYFLRVESEGYKSAQGEVVVNGESEDVNIKLSRSTYEFTVNVTDSKGNPVNSNITLGDKRKIEASSVTYEVEKGDYLLAVNTEGYNRLTRNISVDGDFIQTTIQLNQTSYNLIAKAVNQDSSPVVANFTVDGDSLSGESVEFEKPEGDYTVEVNADGFEPASANVTLNGDRKVTVRLVPEEGDDNTIIILVIVLVVVLALIVSGIAINSRRSEDVGRR